jgi:hypothetical protein
MTDSEK